MDRRSLLRYLAVSGAMTCPICLAAAKSAGAASGGHAWGYEGKQGPEHWGELDAGYGTCSAGTQQSPIDLSGSVQANLADVPVSYWAMPLKILNNGHTVQCNAAPGSHILVEGVRYDLLQFHFHHPSEHAIEGKRFDMEVHFVHRSEAGALSVLGVMIASGTANEALGPVFDAMPMQEAKEREIEGVTIEPARILPRNRSLFRYFGSLTTPPCSEGVNWLVLKTPVEASPEQIGKFAQAFPGNARPLQELHRRFILHSG